MVKDDTSIKIKEKLEVSRTKEALLAKLLENSSQPFGVGYPDGRLGLVNKAFEALTGYSREELKSTDWSKILTPPEFQNMENEKLEELQRTGQPVRYEKEYIRKDRTRIPIELLVNIVKNEDGTPEYYYSFITDISERKISERLKQELLEKEQQLTEELTVSNEELIHQGDELLKINKALEMSEKRYRNILDNLQDAYIRADKDGNIIMASPSAAHIYGFDSPQDMMGTKALSFYKNPEDRIYVLVELKKHGKVENNEVEALRKDGTSFFVSQNAQFYYDENNQVLGTETSVRDITERKRTEYELRESEKKYHSLYNSMNEGVALHEIIYNSYNRATDYFIYDVNPAYEDITGLNKSKVVGKKASELYGTGNPPYIEIYANVAEKGEPKEFETYFEPMDKCFRISVISPDKGKFATIFEDITKRKHDEEFLKESEHKHRRFFESNLIGVIYWNMENKILDANNKFLDMVGYTHEDLEAGRINWSKMTPPEYRHLDENSVAELKATGVNKVPFEKVYIHKDGTRIPILIAGAMIDEAKFNGVAFVLDITERKKVEENLKESEERLCLAQTLGNVGIWDWNTITDELHFTPELEQLYGLTPGTIKTYQDWRKLSHPDDIGIIEAERDQNISNHEPFDLEFRIFHKSGEIRWLSARGGAIYNDKGDVLRVLGVNTDITKQKNIEENLKTTMDKLKLSNKELEQFAYITSHDLARTIKDDNKLFTTIRTTL